MNKTNTQQPTVKENTALSNVGKKIAAMEQRLGKIEKLVECNHVVYKLEDLCINLYKALADLSLALPPLVSFERYLHKLTNADDVSYVIDLIHLCWLYVNPSSFFDRQIDSELSDDEITAKIGDKIADKIIFKNSKQDMDRHNIGNTLYHRIYKNYYSEKGRQRHEDYKNYMNDLYVICNTVCKKFGIKLNESFIISKVRFLNSKLSRTQVESVFKVVAQAGKMNDNEDNKFAFNSLFSESIFEGKKEIDWLDTTKSKKNPNYASLYVMFKAMGVDMTEDNRKLICERFKTPQGAIDPKQLKSRKPSGNLKQFEKQVKDALQLKP